MSENNERNDPWAPPASSDPWAPPENRAPQDRVELGKRELGTPASPSAPHDRPTMTSMPNEGFGPAGSGEIPPPPIAPGGPAQPAPGAMYGYPAPSAMPTGPGPQPGAAYGYPAGYSPYGQPGWQAAPANGMGITAMVLGIVAVVGFCLYGLGAIIGILALIFGIIARKKVQRGEANNGGMATAGIVLGSIGIAIGAAFLGLMIWVIANDLDKEGSDNPWDSSSTVLVVDRTR